MVQQKTPGDAVYVFMRLLAFHKRLKNSEDNEEKNMRIKCNYCVKYNKKIQELLNHHRIAYKMVGDGRFVQKMVTFSVYADESVYSELRKYTWQKPIMTKEFTEEELNSAAYLTLLPLEENVDIKNVEEAYQFECKSQSNF